MGMMAFEVIVLIVVILVLAPAAWAGWSTAPFVPTWGKDMDRLLNLINLKPGEKFVELGCGAGQVLAAVAGKNPKAEVIGVEIQPVLFLWAKWWLKFRQLKNIQLIWGDFLKVDLSDASVVYLYLTPEANAKIKPMLENKLPGGATVISYAFEFLGWKAVTVSREKSRLPIFVYKIN